MYADKDYILNLRHKIHKYPEIGFDLPKTVSVVKREPDKLGIEYTNMCGIDKKKVTATDERIKNSD